MYLLTQQTQKLRQQTLLQRVEFEKNLSCFKETKIIPSLQKYLEFVQLLRGDEEELSRFRIRITRR